MTGLITIDHTIIYRIGNRILERYPEKIPPLTQLFDDKDIIREYAFATAQPTEPNYNQHLKEAMLYAIAIQRQKSGQLKPAHIRTEINHPDDEGVILLPDGLSVRETFYYDDCSVILRPVDDEGKKLHITRDTGAMSPDSRSFIKRSG